jgi:hypothetical protein
MGGGGGSYCIVHMCMLIGFVCAARIVSRYRGKIVNVIGLLPGLKDSLEPRIILYLKVIGLLPGLKVTQD